MKKFFYLLLLIVIIGALASCGWNSQPMSTTRPVPAASSSPYAEDPENPDQTAEPTASSAVTTSASPEDIASRTDNRAEIATMIRDAEELIHEGLFDDATMVLRDLRSRNLTREEEKKVNELQSKLITISD